MVGSGRHPDVLAEVSGVPGGLHCHGNGNWHSVYDGEVSQGGALDVELGVAGVFRG